MPLRQAEMQILLGAVDPRKAIMSKLIIFIQNGIHFNGGLNGRHSYNNSDMTITIYWVVTANQTSKTKLNNIPIYVLNIHLNSTLMPYKLIFNIN